MISILVPFIIRHFATSTIISVLAVLLSLYKFTIRPRNHQPSKTRTSSPPETNLTALFRHKYSPNFTSKFTASQALKDLGPVVSNANSPVLAIINTVAGLNIEIRCRDWHRQIQSLRLLLATLDLWLVRAQGTVRQLQHQLAASENAKARLFGGNRGRREDIGPVSPSARVVGSRPSISCRTEGSGRMTGGRLNFGKLFKRTRRD